MPSKVWDEINYPFPNLNGCTIELWEWISNFIRHFIMDVITYPFLGLKLYHVSKGGHRQFVAYITITAKVVITAQYHIKRIIHESIPRIMHTVRALLCLVCYWSISPCPYLTGNGANLRLLQLVEKQYRKKVDKWITWIHKKLEYNLTWTKHNKTMCIFMAFIRYVFVFYNDFLSLLSFQYPDVTWYPCICLNQTYLQFSISH